MTQQMVYQLQITGPSGEQTVKLSGGTAVAGRQAGVDLVLKNKLISRRHASFICTEEGCTVTDLKSSNGTKVNGTRLIPNEPSILNDGDIIEIGPFKLTYTQSITELEPVIEAEPEPKEPEEQIEAAPAPEPVEIPLPEIAVELKPEPPVAAKAPPPPLPPADDPDKTPPPYQPPPGLSMDRSEYLKYLPDIYHTDFMARFLAMFESIYLPARWNIDNFDLFLNPQTAPDGFLPWLAGWFELTFDNSWSDTQRRTLLTEAHEIYAQRGTKKALSRILEIYTGQKPLIDDTNDDLKPFTFTVRIPKRKLDVNAALIEDLINFHKPAHTNYKLKLKR